jgi:hypothetical protein
LWEFGLIWNGEKPIIKPKACPFLKAGGACHFYDQAARKGKFWLIIDDKIVR